MVLFYADENFEGDIIRALRLRLVDILTIQEDGRASLKPDSLVLDRATELGRVLVSMDTDLIEEAVKRMRTGTDFAGVIFVRKDRSRWARYIDDLEAIAKASDLQEYRARLIFLPL